MIGWGDVIGHERVVGALRRAVDERRPHHAYLLLGPAGAGKMTVARLLAAGLICEADGPRPCGLCASCRKVDSGSHADVWAEEPGGRSKTIVVDQVAEIQRRLSYRKLEGAFRVVLVDNAGTMNEVAQNKLLKTLEEPPPGTVIVLCALHPGQMLVTVRSRCQKLSLGSVDPAALVPWLEQEHGASPDLARSAAAGSHGLPGLAVSLIDPEIQQARAERLADLTASMAGEREAIDRVVEQVDRDREGALEVLTLLQELLRDAMVDCAGGPLPPRHPDAEPRKGLLAQRDVRHLAGLVDRVEASRDRLSRNVHPGWVVEDLLVHLSTRSAWP